MDEGLVQPARLGQVGLLLHLTFLLFPSLPESGGDVRKCNNS